MTKFLLTAAVALLTGFQAFPQQTKVLTAEKHNEYGLVYSLPTTALRITVTAQKETFTAGPFHQYAKRYTAYPNAIAEDAVIWKITEVSAERIGVKGDTPEYLMQLKAGATTFIGVSDNGMLLSINAEPEAPDFDSDNMAATRKTIRDEGKADDYLKYVNMDFVSAQNSMKQAEMIAGALMDVRETILDLKSGNSDNMPADGRQYELMIRGLEDQEKALNRAFTGTSSLEEYVSEFIYIPQREGEEILFRLSDFRGFTDADDYSGSPVYIKTEILQEGRMPTDVNGETKKFPKDGVVYAIPGTARISIYTDRDRLYAAESSFAQFGTTFGLAPSLFTDKKAPSYAVFSPITGEVTEIGKVEKKAEATE